MRSLHDALPISLFHGITGHQGPAFIIRFILRFILRRPNRNPAEQKPAQDKGGQDQPLVNPETMVENYPHRDSPPFEIAACVITKMAVYRILDPTNITIFYQKHF